MMTTMTTTMTNDIKLSRRVGRKPKSSGDKLWQRSLQMTNEQFKKISDVGEGNPSAGVRIMIDAYDTDS